MSKDFDLLQNSSISWMVVPTNFVSIKTFCLQKCKICWKVIVSNVPYGYVTSQQGKCFKSLIGEEDSIVRIVICTSALGCGINCGDVECCTLWPITWSGGLLPANW